MLNQNESELIFNDDGSVYHLKLKPSNISNSIILVGDPQRVELISKYFHSIEFSVTNREFKTTTGVYNNKRISVISTGIGSGNIDIVLNELDSLVNKLKPNRTSKYVHVSEGYKLGVYEYDLYKSDVDSSFITGLSMKPNGKKPDVMYVPRLFEYNWWAVESMPCNKISFRVSSI